jgi:hypothetical protein
MMVSLTFAVLVSTLNIACVKYTGAHPSRTLRQAADCGLHLALLDRATAIRIYADCDRIP